MRVSLCECVVVVVVGGNVAFYVLVEGVVFDVLAFPWGHMRSAPATKV